jgi:hypothetical protein
MDQAANPFAVMSLIVAPAILTNACSVLVMSTSNRLARAVDRARELSRQLEADKERRTADDARLFEDLAAAERRALLLLRALQSFYSALSGFAAAALLSLIGAVMAPVKMGTIVLGLEIATVIAGSLAVATLIYGCLVLLHETRLAVQVLRDRAAAIRTRRSEGKLR